jgi:N6-adenosine-specific RNA methylase IME4
MTNDLVVVKVDQARRLLAEARDAGQAKRVADMARAVEVYAKRQKLSEEAITYATNVRVDAMTLLGEFLRDGPKAKGGQPYQKKSTGGKNPPVEIPTLEENGIGKNEAKSARALARLKNSEPIIFEDVRAGRTSLPAARRAARRKEKLVRVEEQAKGPRVVDGLEALIAAGERFGTIYADPPWKYDNQATRAATSNHYKTHTADEIAAWPVAEVAAENGHLHLWVTNAFLFEARRVLEAWGFEYKSVLVWVKPQLGIGNYWRVSHEFLLLGVRGDCPFPEGQKCHQSWLEARRGSHSTKPRAFRELIEQVSPGPRLELFGRHPVPGWTVLGNQVAFDLFTAPEATADEK